MRKLVTLLLAVAMVLAMLTVAVAEEPYTLDIYWVGNGDNEAVRAGVEAAVNEYIEPLIGAKVSYHIIGWGDWNDKAINALQSGEKMDLIFTADWEGYGVPAACCCPWTTCSRSMARASRRPCPRPSWTASR